MSNKKVEGKILEKNMLDIYNRIAAKAHNGDLESCFVIGLALQDLQTFKDNKKSFAIFKDLAKCGYIPAKTQVAFGLFNGRGVKQNFLKSYKLFAELAEDDSNIKDMCVIWAAFEFNGKFVKEMKSSAKCKKGSQYIENAILGIDVELWHSFQKNKDYMELDNAEYAYRRFYDEEGTADFLIAQDDIDMNTIAQLYYVDDEDNTSIEKLDSKTKNTG